MKSIAYLVVASVVLLGCPSTQELCRLGVDQVCERNFECQSDAVKASAQFQAGFGTSVDECKTLLYANPTRPLGQAGIACDDVDKDQELCANLGMGDRTDFELGKAQDCKKERAEMSCQDYLAQQQNPSLAPAACAERCK